MVSVLLCHDRPDLAPNLVRYLRQVLGYKVTLCDTAEASLRRIKEGLSEFTVTILHKGIGEEKGEKIDISNVVQAVHEEDETMRIGVVSGECPDGKEEVKKELQADFYFDPVAPVYDKQWFKSQTEAGPLGSEELKARGKTLDMPPEKYGGVETRY